MTRRPLFAIKYSRMRRSRLGRGKGSPSISGSRPSENTLILPASGCCASLVARLLIARDPGKNFAHMHRLANHVIHTRGEQVPAYRSKISFRSSR